VVTMSNKHSLSKSHYLDPQALTSDIEANPSSPSFYRWHDAYQKYGAADLKR
jgi:hypothetical protein